MLEKIDFSHLDQSSTHKFYYVYHEMLFFQEKIFLDQLRFLQQEIKCSICLDYLNLARTLPCGHWFCEDCVLRSLSFKARCPLCKSTATKRGLRPSELPNIDLIVENIKKTGEIMEKLRTLDDHLTEVLVEKHFYKCGDVYDPTLSHSVHSTSTNPTEQLTHESISKKSRKPKLFAPIMDHADTSTGACGFCHLSTQNKSVGKLIGPYPVSRKADPSSFVYVHYDCAIWSPEVYSAPAQPDDVFLRLDVALNRSKKINCLKCKNQGATLGCRVPTCKKSWHFPCALESGCLFVKNIFGILCTEHKKNEHALQEISIAAGIPVSTILEQDCCFSLESDTDSYVEGITATQGHDDSCFDCGEPGVLVCCDGCPRAYHIACADPALNGCPADQDWFCKQCIELGRHLSILSSQALFDQISTTDGDNLEEAKQREVQEPHNLRNMKQNERTNKKTDRKHKRRHNSVISKKQKRTQATKVKSSVPVILATGLEDWQKDFLEIFCKKNSTHVVNEFTDKVTHVVCNATEPSEKARRTFKYCLALLSDRPLLSYGWVLQSNAVGTWVDHKDFEMTVFNAIKGSNHKVFENQSYCLSEYTGEQVSRKNVEKLIILGGGKIVARSNASEQTLYISSQNSVKKDRVSLCTVLDQITEFEHSRI